MNYFPMVNPVHRVHISVDRPGVLGSPWRPGDDGAYIMGRRRRSVRGLLRWGEREIGPGRGAVKLGEGARLLEGPGEHQGGVAGAVNADVNGFNTIEDGPT
jgi:hypothetical protein